MSSDVFIGLSSGWSVLLCAGLLLDGITVACLAGSPLAGFVTVGAVGELTGECL